jgi:hypothetical protein
MKRILSALALVLATVSTSRAAGQTLYAATGSNGVPGNLYTVNPATGVSTLVGPTLINNPANCPLAPPCAIGLTGLAVHPVTAVVYGATSNSIGTTNLKSLVTIDPATGAATLIGVMATPVADIGFDSGGTLYGWSANQGGNPSPVLGLFTIDLTTAAQARVLPGDSSFPKTGGNGLSFARGTLFLSEDGAAVIGAATGALRTVDPATGVTTVGPTLTGAPRPGTALKPGTINSLAVDPTGVLFGVNSDNSGLGNAICNLVVINPGTGAVSDHGSLPDNTDALAFTNGALGATAGSFFPVTPCRVLDTRETVQIPAGGTRTLIVTGGACGIAAAATAVSLNVAVTDVAATGNLVLYAANLAVPSTSAISFDTGRTRANNAIVQVATDGSGAINIVNVSAGQLDVVVDVNGYFQ